MSGGEGGKPAAAGDQSTPGGANSRWARPGCVTLRCRENGPLVVELPEPAPGSDASPVTFRVIDHEGREFALPTGKRAVALCRCGHSARRPFCDGSHRAAGFRAAETASRAALPPAPQAEASRQTGLETEGSA